MRFWREIRLLTSADTGEMHSVGELFGHNATVHHQSMSGDERSGISAEINGSGGDFLGRAQSAEGNPGLELCFQVRFFPNDPLDHRRARVSGAEGVDAKALLGVFECRGFCQADYAMLAGGVGGVSGKARHSGHR